MLKIDNLTLIHDRGKYARICVEMVLDKPLLSHIIINDEKLILEYEGLHSICFRCGRYRHKKESFTEVLTTMPKDPMASSRQLQMNRQS